MIRIEFWNGQTSHKKKYEKYGGLVTTKHNPCLWTNYDEVEKPWRSVYPKALEYVNQFLNKEINPTDLLHALRYVAYGYNNSGEDKRDYNNADVIWAGNLTIDHKPKLVVKDKDKEYTIYFHFDQTSNKSEDLNPTDDRWLCKIVDEASFYWEL